MWGEGRGWMGILFWIVLILAIGALIKYLFGGKPRDSPAAPRSPG